MDYEKELNSIKTLSIKLLENYSKVSMRRNYEDNSFSFISNTDEYPSVSIDSEEINICGKTSDIFVYRDIPKEVIDLSVLVKNIYNDNREDIYVFFCRNEKAEISFQINIGRTSWKSGYGSSNNTIIIEGMGFDEAIDMLEEDFKESAKEELAILE